MGMSRADNSIKIWRNLPISNPKPDLHNINAHTKFGENPLMFTQVIIRKRKMDGHTTDRQTHGRPTRNHNTPHYCVAGYKNIAWWMRTLLLEFVSKVFWDLSKWCFALSILAIFDLLVTLILPTKFRVSWPFCSGEEVQNRFSIWRQCRPSWISNLMILAFFDHKSPWYFLPSFESNE